MRALRAIIPYFGGKRRFLARIFDGMPAPAVAPVFVDAFAGGGSVSLFAKARGYEVVTNDISIIGHIIGHALIANSRAKIQEAHVAAIASRENRRDWIVQNFVPGYLTSTHAAFLDSMVDAAWGLEGSMRWLLLMLAVRTIFHLQPHNNFSNKAIIGQVERGEWDAMNQQHIAGVKDIRLHPVSIAHKVRAMVNDGIFPNARENRAYNVDAGTLIEDLLPGGDILYLDPPYPGVQSYEKWLAAAESMIMGFHPEAKTSPYSNKAQGVATFENLLSRGTRYRRWVISYGDSVIDLDALVKMVGKFKKVIRAEAIPITYCAEHGEQRKNAELLVVAEGGR